MGEERQLERKVLVEVSRPIFLRAGSVISNLRSGEYQGTYSQTSSGRSVIRIPGLPFDLERGFLERRGVSVCEG